MGRFPNIKFIINMFCKKINRELLQTELIITDLGSRERERAVNGTLHGGCTLNYFDQFQYK